MSTPFSTSSNPYTLTGTDVVETSSDMTALSARVHRRSMNAQTLIELWYNRDSTWSLFPLQPAGEIRIQQERSKIASMECDIIDNNGNLTPENLDSDWNYNGASEYDALIKIGRQVLLRVGAMCFTNLASGITPTASSAPTAGTLAALTDGTFSTWTGTPASYGAWTLSGAGTITLTFDLGSLQTVRHAVVRWGTRLGAYLLPSSVKVSVSADNVTYFTPKPAQSVSGDWQDSYTGQVIESMICDMDVFSPSARYVKFTIETESALTFGIDQIAIYGGNGFAYNGRNIFCGYIGSGYSVTPAGKVSLACTDTLQKSADNATAYITAGYEQQDVATITDSLLTSSGYWAGLSESGYDSALSTSQVGWHGTTAGFVYPRWQGVGNSLYGYVDSLWGSLGYLFYADGNGVYQSEALTFDQYIPDRVFIADPDGNYDVRQFIRNYSAANIRNSVRVSTGQVSSGAGMILEREPNSCAYYGVFETAITDPILTTPSLQQRMALNFLRDYAWRDQEAHCEISPDFDTFYKRIVGVRASLRPSVFPKASTTTGDKRKAELWQIEQITHKITYGAWSADVTLSPFTPSAQDPPVLTGLDSPTGQTYIDATFTAISNAKVSSVNLYVSTSQYSGYTLATSGIDETSGTGRATGLTGGTRYYVYLTTVDYRGQESLPSNKLSVIVGGGAANSGWAVSDLSAIITKTSSTPDAAGYYAYEVTFQWTSPGTVGDNPANGGFKRMQIRGNPLTNPNSYLWNTSDWAWQDSGWEWHGDYVPPTMSWDRVTPGYLYWKASFRVATPFTTGQKVYWRMWTCDNTTEWGNNPIYYSNICDVTF